MRTAALVLSVLALAGCRTAAPPVADAVVYVVRHAERLDASNDPPLSDAGIARADALADSLDRWGRPEVVFSTAFVRTRETARPAAQRARVELNTYQATSGNTMLAQAMRRLLAPGQQALIVGHSNTVPALLNAFDGGTRPDLHHGDYDGVYIVTLREGRATVRRVRYGADDGVPDPG